MDRSLFDIQAEYLNTIEELEQYLIENDTDEIPEEYFERLSINKDELAEKLRNYHLAIKSYEARMVNIREEELRLANKRKGLERTKDRLRELMTSAVKEFGDVVPKSTNAHLAKNRKFTSEFINATFIRTFPVVEKGTDETPSQYKQFTVTLPKDLDETTAQAIYNLIVKAIPPEEVMRWSDTPKLIEAVDTKKVKAALKAEVPVPGFELDLEAGYVKIT